MKRQDLHEEIMLRLRVQKFLQEALDRRLELLTEEWHLREGVRRILKEGQEKVFFKNTGANELAEHVNFVMKSFDKIFNSLSTSQKQRFSFVANLVNMGVKFVERTLMNKEEGDGDSEDEQALAEADVSLDTEVGEPEEPKEEPDPNRMFKKPSPKPEKKPDDMSDALPNTDPTGLSKAKAFFKSVGGDLADHLEILSDPEDFQTFQELWPKNIIEMARQYESSLSGQEEADKFADMVYNELNIAPPEDTQIRQKISNEPAEL